MRLTRRSILAGGILAPALFAASAPARAQAAARTFMVYFNQGTAELSSDATQVVDAAGSYASQNRMRGFEIVGHCDTAEPDPHKLSVQRAQAVRARLGVEVGAMPMSANGVGASSLAVPTGPNTSEPLNRFVSIRIY